MEKRLRALIESGNESRRTEWALEAKRQGKKVVGTLCPYVPEEVIYAAGMLPWRIRGSRQEGTRLAAMFRPNTTNLYYNHVLESILSGELDFLDGVVVTTRYDDSRRIWDIFATIGKPAFAHLMYLPHHNRETGVRAMRDSIADLVSKIGQLAGMPISDESLHRSIDLFNRMRRLLTEIYDLRKRERPPLSGAEVLGITTAASVMPKDVFCEELEAILPYLRQRDSSDSRLKPRLMVSGDMIDDLAFLKVIENTGALVAMDDMDIGCRYFWQSVNSGTSDPLEALARRYLVGPADPRLFGWDWQADRVIGWAKEFNIQGLVQLSQIYYYPRQFSVPYFKSRFLDSGIPAINIEVRYVMSGVEQFKTKIEAFVEMIDGIGQRSEKV